MIAKVLRTVGAEVKLFPLDHIKTVTPRRNHVLRVHFTEQSWYGEDFTMDARSFDLVEGDPEDIPKAPDNEPQNLNK